MLVAGLGIPLLASLNAQLGGRIGSPALAAFMLFMIAGLVALAVALATGGLAALPRLVSQPPSLFLAGGFIAFYVLSISWIAPRFGLGNAVFCVLLGQILCASVIDHFGLFGTPRQLFTPLRGIGIAAMVTGLILQRSIG
ncbi:MAG: DMT family transporter [Rhodobacteraceae bacterium]|nr:DMT family transporter [Paracoccaceae bacterium]